MKITRPFFLTTLVALLIVANSCKVTHPNEKLLIGKWTPVTVEKYSDELSQKAAPASGTTKSTAAEPSRSKPQTDTASSRNQRAVGDGSPDANAENMYNRQIATEQRTSLEIYTEKKTVVKQYPGKTIKGTWKMKKKGTQVTAKDNVTGKKLTLDLQKINDTSAVVIERFPFGDIRITYKKEK